MVAVRAVSRSPRRTAAAEGESCSRERDASGPSPAVGVLALQGDFAAHARALERCGARAIEIRRASELDAVVALVVPGGESTTLLKLLRAFDLWDPLRRFAASGRALFGTCAGLILFAEEVTGPAQEALGLLPVAVERNAYGRQVDSFVDAGSVRVPEDLRGDLEGRASFETEFVFIRAPRITRVGPGVEVLATHRDDPVLVRRDSLLAATFHPELGTDGDLIRLFLAVARRAQAARRI